MVQPRVLKTETGAAWNARVGRGEEAHMIRGVARKRA